MRICYNNPLMQIGLNAHLLSSAAGYRTAGIHGYIDGLLRHLPAAVPDDWRLTAFVGAANTVQIDGMTMRRSRLDTESPLRRILWEQAVQPFAARRSRFVSRAGVRRAADFERAVGRHDLRPELHPLPAAPARLAPPLSAPAHRADLPPRPPRDRHLAQHRARSGRRRSHLPADKIDVAPPGYDPAVFRPLPAEQIAAFRPYKQPAGTLLAVRRHARTAQESARPARSLRRAAAKAARH